MIERRKISEGPQETEQSLEQRVIAALTTDKLSSGDLEKLIGEVEAAVTAFDTTAREEHALALDILAAPDANAARERALTAELNRDRLRNGHSAVAGEAGGGVARRIPRKMAFKVPAGRS